MGNWLLARGRLEIEPPVTEDVVLEYIDFCKNTWPEEYKRVDERFANPWFFDGNSSLLSITCKFVEFSVWLPYIKNFFRDRGYEVTGDLDVVGECEEGYDSDANEEEYQIWRKRAVSMLEERRIEMGYSRIL